MLSTRIAAGAISCFLTACASSSMPRQPSLVPPSLLQPCDLYTARAPMATNGDLVRAYVEALAWGADCRRRHQALSEAVRAR